MRRPLVVALGGRASRRAWRRAVTTTAPRASPCRPPWIPTTTSTATDSDAAARRARSTSNRSTATRSRPSACSSPTAAALIDRSGGGYVASPTGQHLALYVEPIDDRTMDEYFDGILDVAVVFSDIYDRWPGLETYDVCQEPPDPDGTQGPEPLPVTQIELTRAESDAIDWDTRHRRGPRAGLAGRPAAARPAGQRGDGGRPGLPGAASERSDRRPTG